MMRGRLLGIMLFCGLTWVSAQDRVYLEHSETLSFDESRVPDGQLLRGDVRFRHDSALMYCDSAYFYEKSNSLTAFGRVRFEQGDTLFGYGDVLYYDGNTKLARLRKNVRLVHRTTTLTTDSMNYDRVEDRVYYFLGGRIVDSLNVLTSLWGEYCPQTHLAKFRDSVRLYNDSSTLVSENLHYNTETNMAYIISSTVINYSDREHIYSSKGWYDTRSEQSMLLDKSVVESEKGRTLTGDTIYYDKRIGLGKVMGNMEARDTVQHASLFGDYGEMWQKEKRGYVTGRAMAEDWSGEKHIYLHADTIFTEEVAFQDSTGRDTITQVVRAYEHVRLYHDDYQMVCDTLLYTSVDSVGKVKGNPICWSEQSQVSADSMTVVLKNGTIHHVIGRGNAMGIKEEDGQAMYYDQVSGKEMTAYWREGEMREVEVRGMAATVYFPRDDDSVFVGVNKTESDRVRIYLQDGKIHHVLFTSETTGTIYPFHSIAEEDMVLPGFLFVTDERPLRKEDIFLHPLRAPREKVNSRRVSKESTADPAPPIEKQIKKRKQ